MEGGRGNEVVVVVVVVLLLLPPLLLLVVIRGDGSGTCLGAVVFDLAISLSLAISVLWPRQILPSESGTETVSSSPWNGRERLGEG